MANEVWGNKTSVLVGDFLFVSKWDYGYSRYSFPFGLAPISGKIFEKSPKRGDIIVFKLPGQENINYVKRLLGLPGETIKVENGLVFIKPKNADTFQQINQIDDGIFIDDQHQKQIQLQNLGYQNLVRLRLTQLYHDPQFAFFGLIQPF